MLLSAVKIGNVYEGVTTVGTCYEFMHNDGSIVPLEVISYEHSWIEFAGFYTINLYVQDKVIQYYNLPQPELFAQLNKTIYVEFDCKELSENEQ